MRPHFAGTRTTVVDKYYMTQSCVLLIGLPRIPAPEPRPRSRKACDGSIINMNRSARATVHLLVARCGVAPRSARPCLRWLTDGTVNLSRYRVSMPVSRAGLLSAVVLPATGTSSQAKHEHRRREIKMPLSCALSVKSRESRVRGTVQCEHAASGPQSQRFHATRVLCRRWSPL